MIWVLFITLASGNIYPLLEWDTWEDCVKAGEIVVAFFAHAEKEKASWNCFERQIEGNKQ
jgi:hypothetical protein